MAFGGVAMQSVVVRQPQSSPTNVELLWLFLRIVWRILRLNG